MNKRCSCVEFKKQGECWTMLRDPYCQIHGYKDIVKVVEKATTGATSVLQSIAEHVDKYR